MNRKVEVWMTELVAVPHHLLTVEEWDALEETDTSKWYELVDGVVVLTPPPLPRHQLAARRLANTLDVQLPSAVVVLHEVGVVIDAAFPPTVRVPDVVVVTKKRLRQNPAHFDPADVLVAVEIVSPGSRRTDRVMKPAEYQEAGIPSYWIVDPEAEGPDRFVAFDLTDGRYVESVRGGGSVKVSQPVPMVVDVGSLLTLD